MGLPGFGQLEERRLRNRALARWLLSAGQETPARNRVLLTTEVVQQGGLWCVRVMAADGTVLASYSIRTDCNGRWYLRASPPGQVAPPIRAQQAAALRKNAAALSPYSRDLHKLCLQLHTRSVAAAQRSALLRARSQVLRRVSESIQSQARWLVSEMSRDAVPGAGSAPARMMTGSSGSHQS